MSRESLKATARWLIEAKGEAITFIDVSVGARPANRTAGRPETETNYPGYGVVTAFKPESIDGANIRSTDLKVLVLADDFAGVVPAANDRITVRGATYNVLSAPADPWQITYKIHARPR